MKNLLIKIALIIFTSALAWGYMYATKYHPIVVIGMISIYLVIVVSIMVTNFHHDTKV